MNRQAENTINRLKNDLRQAVLARAAQVGLRTNSEATDQNRGRTLVAESEYLVDELVERLRRNWTVTERARSQRRVPPR